MPIFSMTADDHRLIEVALTRKGLQYAGDMRYISSIEDLTYFDCNLTASFF